MQVSVLSGEQVSNLLTSGIPQKEIPIMEDLVRMLLPQSRYIDVFEEAYRKYREIKRIERSEALKKQKIAEADKKRRESMAIHGEIESMANGKVYWNKGAYLADIRAMGYTDVGNEDIVAHAAKQKKEIEKKIENERETHVNNILAKLIN